MRLRELALTGGALLTLGACAAPHAIGQGDVAGLRGAAVAAYPSQADGGDAAFARAVQTRAIARLGGRTDGARPAYLIQVGVALTPPTVGVSSAAGALDERAWRSRPPVRSWPWSGAGPVRTVTLAVVNVQTGKTEAWASIRAPKGEPAAVADLLVAALQAPARS